MVDSIWAELFPEVSEWSRWEASDIDVSLKGELAGASESTAVFTWAESDPSRRLVTPKL
jgi:hypothetical protein